MKLAELLIAISLMGIMLALGLPNLRMGQTGVSAQGVAELVGEQLRLARQEAIASRTPVAVGFPSANGTTPISQSLYFLSGLQTPRVKRVLDLHTEYPESGIFVGPWAGPTWTLNPGPLPWAPPNRDPLFVFTPQGTVVTNDLPFAGGNYHLAVCQGAEFSPAATPPGAPSVTPAPAYFQPTRMARPYTISVSVTGAVTVQPGLLLATVAAVEHVLPLGNPPSPPALALSPNANPSFSSVGLEPSTVTAMLPPGVTATVSENTHLTLTVNATDPDGDVLYCDWKAEDSSGNEVGGFSSLSEEEMEWENGVWRSVWQWRSPPGAQPGDIFRLKASVRDARGGVAAAASGAVQDVQFINEGRILYLAQTVPGDWTNNDIMTLSGDGSGPRKILSNHPGAALPARFSPDGTKVAYASASTGISVMNADGSLPRQLTNDGGLEPSWSPDGTKIVYVGPGGQTGIRIMNADGTGGRQVHMDPPWSCAFPAISTDGSTIVCNRYNGIESSLWLMDLNGGSLRRLVMVPGHETYFPYWQPNPALPPKIQFTLWRPGDLSDVAIINPDGTGLTLLTAPLGTGNYPGGGYSPDGTRIVFSRLHGGSQEFYQMNADGSGVKRLRQLLGIPVSWAP